MWFEISRQLETGNQVRKERLAGIFVMLPWSSRQLRKCYLVTWIVLHGEALKFRQIKNLLEYVGKLNSGNSTTYATI